MTAPPTTSITRASAATAAARILIRARTFMLAGLLWSYFGTTVVEGATPVLVAVGLIPLIWIPLMTTVENVQDLFSAAAARWLERFRAGTILVASEVADLALTGITCAVIISVPKATTVALCAYIAAVSFLPLLIDLAEEFYGAEIEHRVPGSAVRFNTILHSALPAIGLLAGGPLGSILAGYSIVVLLAVNAAASGVAIMCRYASLRIADRAELDTPAFAADEPDEVENAVHEAHSAGRLRFGELMALRGAGSPLFSGALPLATGLSAAYLGQWAASLVQNKGAFFATFTVFVGLGSLLGAPAARVARRRHSPSTVLYAGSALTALFMLIGAVAALWAHDWADHGRTSLVLAGVLVYSTVTSFLLAAVLVTQITARQEVYRGPRFVQVMSWGHSLSACGTLLGVWGGLALQAQRAPSIALVVGAVMLAGVYFLLFPVTDEKAQ